MTFNFLGPGLTVNVEAKVKEQIILDSSEAFYIFQQQNYQNFSGACLHMEFYFAIVRFLGCASSSAG